MDKQKFIEQYQKKINSICPEFQKDHYIKDNHICNNFLGKIEKINIDKAIKIVELYKNARQYIYNLKAGDKIKLDYYANISDVKVLKINYKKSLSPKGKKIISSLIVLGSYENKIKITDIQYRGIRFYDLKTCALHCNGNFLTFTQYESGIVDNFLEISQTLTND